MYDIAASITLGTDGVTVYVSTRTTTPDGSIDTARTFTVRDVQCVSGGSYVRYQTDNGGTGSARVPDSYTTRPIPPRVTQQIVAAAAIDADVKRGAVAMLADHLRSV